MPSDPYTTASGIVCGSSCLRRIRRPPMPAARAASTNWASRRVTIFPYTIRATAAHWTDTITKITRAALGLTTAASAIASSRTGNESARSIRRVSSVSSGTENSTSRERNRSLAVGQNPAAAPERHADDRREGRRRQRDRERGRAPNRRRLR